MRIISLAFTADWIEPATGHWRVLSNGGWEARGEQVGPETGAGPDSSTVAVAPASARSALLLLRQLPEANQTRREQISPAYFLSIRRRFWGADGALGAATPLCMLAYRLLYYGSVDLRQLHSSVGNNSAVNII